MKVKGMNPTPSDGSTSSRSRSLKQKLLNRDGRFAAVGLVIGKTASVGLTSIHDPDYDVLEVAHIIPSSASSRSSLRAMVSRFALQDIGELLTRQKINDPFNALLLDAKTHKSFDSFEFGLECQISGTEVSRHDEGEKVVFGQQSHRIAPPSPLFCNPHLAVGRVLHASGAAEVIDKILKDEDEFHDGNVEGDYWLRVSASYPQRKLMQNPDRYDGDSDTREEDLPIACIMELS
ncbi:hypothetical protein V1523DRAFT_446765 [Lipomyces doorenjongii]